MATAPAHLLLILDTETTGLDEAQHKVIEIAAILYSVEHHCVLQQISTLIPSGQDKNPAEAINQIPIAAANATPSELSHYLCQVINYWGEIAEYVVAHNADFDRKWLKQHAIFARLYEQHWLCTCHDFTWPQQHRSGQKLIDLALAHGVGVNSAHRALTDCQLLAALFDRLEDLPERIAAAAGPKVWVKAEIEYRDRQLAKDAGFRWDSGERQWICKLSQASLKHLPFPCQVLGDRDLRDLSEPSQLPEKIQPKIRPSASNAAAQNFLQSSEKARNTAVEPITHDSAAAQAEDQDAVPF